MATASTPGIFPWTGGADLAQAVRVSRLAAGMTQSALADRARVCRRFVCALEQGKETLRADKLFKVFRALELEAALGQKGSGEPVPPRPPRPPGSRPPS